MPAKCPTRITSRSSRRCKTKPPLSWLKSPNWNREPFRRREDREHELESKPCHPERSEGSLSPACRKIVADPARRHSSLRVLLRPNALWHGQKRYRSEERRVGKECRS